MYPPAVIDVETTELTPGEFPKTLFWGFADSAGYRRFETTKDLLRFLRPYSPRLLLHHSNFDILQLLLDGAKLQICRSYNGKIIRCTLGNHSTLNSHAVFPVSLATVFHSFGFDKTALSDLEKRNYDDCVLALQCFLDLDAIIQKICGVSCLQRGTIASTGFHAAELEAGKKMPEDLRFLSAYRGGRVEAFHLQETEADRFDINSSYPSSIMDAPRNVELWQVKVKTKDFFCPLFDAAETDTLIFPNGTFTSWVFRDVWERYIEPHTKQTSIKIAQRVKLNFSWLKSVQPLLEKLYCLKRESREQGQAATELCAKLLLNSLYGRMGLRPESERAKIWPHRVNRRNAIMYKLRRGQWLIFETLFRPVKANYPFAAYVTDNARARLFAAFVKSQACYGDTDSVFTERGKSDLLPLLGDGCGKWKYEGREKFRALNVKDYFWGEKEVRKGGKHFLQWTLKTMASGSTVKEIFRHRLTELRKRELLPDGLTIPLCVSH